MFPQHLDLALFSATMAAFVGHYHYQRKSCRRAKTVKQVSFRLDASVHSTVADMLPSMELSQTQSAPIIGLLFSASWCPDCWDAVPAIDKVVSGHQNLLEVIYVASERNEAEMLKFKPSTMKHIPFSQVEERSELKRKFSTCAAKEMRELEMTERKNGTPTLILLETATGRILTESGVDDVFEGKSPDAILKRWNSMLSSANKQ